VTAAGAARRVPDVAVLALVQVVFGSLAVVGKVALPQVGPYALVAVRIGLAAIVLVALERLLVAHPLTRRDVPTLAGLSLLGVALNQVLFLLGLSMTTAVEATVLITTIPVFTMAVGLAWGKESWSPRKGLGIAVAFAGVVVLVGASALEFGSATFLGNLFVVLNAAFYAVFLVASRPVLERMPPLTLTAGTFAIAAILVLPVGVWGLGQVQPGGPDASGWAAIAYIILGPTVLTYFLVSYALVRVPASTVASFIYLQPLVAGLLAVLFLGEPLTPRTLGAAALIFAGVALAASAARRPRRFVPAT
jgi:drug/metabolite transporter (DMT)-like permease